MRVNRLRANNQFVQRIKACRLAAICGLASVALALGACGGDDDDASQTPGPTNTPPSTPEATLSAEPATVTVVAGGEEGPVQVRAFLPEEITIRVGDTIRWEAASDRHTVSFLGGAEPFALIVPEPSSPADAVLNPLVVNPQPSPLPASYDGSLLLSSGFFGEAEADGPAITFSAAGSYDYQCLVHSQMTGTVNVVDDSSAVPDQAAIDEQAREERQGHVEEAEDQIQSLRDDGPQSADGPNETTAWEVIAGFSTDHADVRLFIPEELEIGQGDTVTWLNSAREPHTITFGEPPIFELAETLPNGEARRVLNPEILNVALGDFEFVSGEFFHSGLLLENGPLGVRFELIFPDNGRFTYVDALYAEMQGVIVVVD
ncbi:MAG: hypothetical protein WEB00_15880 [Dehalococcoidia bacterium]